MTSTSPAKGSGPTDGIYPSSRAERVLLVAAIAIASIGLGYLFFTQLWWKVPPDFNCAPDFESRGLCTWVGKEVRYADEPHKLLQADIVPSRPGPEVGVPMRWASNLNAVFVENVVQANIRWFGWIIFATEAFIFLTLTLGFMSRLGALVAVGMSLQLTVGLAHTPHEWEWSYLLMVLLSVVLFGLAPGRYFGLDRLLRPRLKVLKERGSRVGRLLLAFT
ncbi:MAG: hypothetical protein M3Q49_11290 [Actinomycetota bacterium]|nr:hypothetical protein [Actinomycetota bacterium]